MENMNFVLGHSTFTFQIKIKVCVMVGLGENMWNKRSRVDDVYLREKLLSKIVSQRFARDLA